MNSFKDLNSYSDEFVSFRSQDDYSIVWGNNLGNATIVANVSVSHNLQNRQLIDAVNNPLLPLVIQVNAPVDPNGVSISNIAYSGPNGNIVVENINNNQWLVGNIWTVNDYNEVFNNTSVSINNLRTDDFAYQTVVSDQLGETRTFFTTVDVVPFGFSRPGSVTYNEDQTAQITGMAITDISNLNYTCTFDLVPALAGNLLINSNQIQGNSVVVSGSRDQVNTVLASGIAYIPADDYVANSNVSVSVFNNSSNTSVGTANIQLLIGQTHADFSVPTSLGYSETANINVGTTQDGNIQITDLATNRQYSSTLTLQDAAIGNLYNGATLLGSTVTYTGNSIQVNNNLANVTFVPNSTANTSSIISYTQIQTTAGITQAANVSIPLTYQVPAIHINSGVPKPVGTRLDNNGGIGGNATPNVDFWAYQYRADSATPSNYTTPITSNVNLNDFRDLVNARFQPMGIRINSNQNAIPGPRTGNGILSRPLTRTPGSAGYFSMWVRLNKLHPYANFCRLDTGSNGGRTWIQSWNSNWYIVSSNDSDPGFFGPWRFFGPGRALSTRINLGPAPLVGEWTHIAVQVSNGTPGLEGNQVVSAWRNGVPLTQFFGINNNLENGSNWYGRLDFEYIKDFVIGAPLPPTVNISSPETIAVGLAPDKGQVFCDITVDDVYMTTQAIRNNLEPFTPVAQSWISPPAAMLLTGV